MNKIRNNIIPQKTRFSSTATNLSFPVLMVLSLVFISSFWFIDRFVHSYFLLPMLLVVMVVFFYLIKESKLNRGKKGIERIIYLIRFQRVKRKERGVLGK